MSYRVLLTLFFLNLTTFFANTQTLDSLAGVYVAKNVARSSNGNYALNLARDHSAMLTAEESDERIILKQGRWKSAQQQVEIEWTEDDGKPISTQMLLDVQQNALNDGRTGLHFEKANLGLAPDREKAKIVGPVWRWEETVKADGEILKGTEEPAKYTIKFLPDGRLIYQGDCNHGSGSYLIHKDRIAIGSIMTTLVACKFGSLEFDFLHPLKSIAIYSQLDTNSRLELKFDAVTMKFVKAD